MTTEDDAKFRYLVRKNRQLPQPMADLLRRVSRSRGVFAPSIPTIQQQAAAQKKEDHPPAPEKKAQPPPERKTGQPPPRRTEEPPPPTDKQSSEAPPPPEPMPQVDEKEAAFKELGIPKGSSMGQIRKAYLKMALQHHPDKGGDQEKFKRIKAAYDILSRSQ